MSVSSLGMTTNLRVSVSRIQLSLTQAQKEASTGRLADVGLSLGGQTSQSLSLQQEQSRLQTLVSANATATTRLSATSNALTDLLSSAQSFMAALVAAKASGDSNAIQTTADASLKSMTATVNTEVGGQFIFAGVNTDVKPIADYDANGSASQAAVTSAFTTAFGVAPNDPGVSNISSSDLQTFLGGSFSSLFQGSAWTSTWSAASDKAIRSRVSSSELTDTSVSANNAAVQGLAQAYTMVAKLGTTKLSTAAFATLLNTATATLSTAMTNLQNLAAGIGATQNQVNAATDRMNVQVSLLTTRVGTLEDVDPYATSTRISALQTQLETAYSLTSQLAQLSLVKYL